MSQKATHALVTSIGILYLPKYNTGQRITPDSDKNATIITVSFADTPSSVHR